MDAAGPEHLLAGLDEAQRAAVTSEAQPLCVLAGAGSGKTRVLTRRIAWRCATGAEDHRHVLALTFTRAAAAELTARLRALGLRDGVRAGTFHAVAWAELRTWEAERGRPASVLLDRPDRLLRRVTSLTPQVVTALAGELAWARARRIPIDRYPAEAARAGRPKDVPAEQVVDVGHDYEREKRKRGLVDFDDLLERVADAMASDPGFAAGQRWRFAHLYVDEFQDLNPLQHALLEAWRGGRPSLTAVGDPNQAIYGWNGSDPSFVEGFTELYPDGEVIAITRNFRSAPAILTVANAILDGGRLGGIRLVPAREEGPVPEIGGYADDDAEGLALARAVLDAHIPGSSWSQQAVLARTNALVRTAAAALAAVGVPVRTRGRPLHDEPIVRAALAELSTPGAVFGEVIAAVADGSHPDAEVDTDDDTGPDEAVRARLVELAERYSRTHQPPDGAGFRAWLVNEAEEGGTSDAVDVLTFHAAKGREWPLVHLYAVEDGYVPIAQAKTAAAIDEERRLFYVACTRAERRLRISWSVSRRFGEGEPAARRASPFVVELGPVVARLRAEAAPAPHPGGVLSRAGAGDPDSGLASLRRWRDARARAAGVAPSALVPDAVLARVLAARPADAAELAAIPGARPLVLAGFADELLGALEG